VRKRSTSWLLRLFADMLSRACRWACERAAREEADADPNPLAIVYAPSGGPTTRTSGTSAVPISGAAYLRHLSKLLDEYMDDVDLIA
jgi:hypothetical protein